ncbi:MAG: hypothetical protein M1133_14065 [Armatimonadetes bacterium]|nr:hypothetical protein [Armatimonadota bacterium]
MKEPERTIEDMALAAREINVIINGVVSRDGPTDAIVLKRAAELARDIEHNARYALQTGDRQEFDFIGVARWISMISGTLYMLSLLHK